MSMFKKSVLGLMAFWPLGYMVGFFVFMFTMVHGQNMDQLDNIFPILFGMHFLTITLCFVQITYRFSFRTCAR